MLLWFEVDKTSHQCEDNQCCGVGLFPVNLMHKYGEDNTASGSDNVTFYTSAQTIINDSWSTNQLLGSWMNLYWSEQHEHLWG